MYLPVVTKDPAAVAAEVQALYREIFPRGDGQFVARVFGWAGQCFTGCYQDYQAIDAPYHDFEHTLQVTLCMARLLRGRHLAGARPPFPEPLFQLGIIAILLHDTGYLKKRGDNTGTGAKYTVTHVLRSKDFAADFLRQKNFSMTDIKAVQNMISCTGVDSALGEIPFQNDLERIAGHALGTADLLGQMAADDYVDKLPILYAEFAEADAYNEKENSYFATFSSAQDLMVKTPAFWEKYVLPKLTKQFGGVYRFLSNPHPFGPNEYLLRIEENIKKLRERVSVASR